MTAVAATGNELKPQSTEIQFRMKNGDKPDCKTERNGGMPDEGNYSCRREG